MKTKVLDKKIPAAKNENFTLFLSGALFGLVLFKFYLTRYILTVPGDGHTYFHLFVAGWLVTVPAGAFLIFLLIYLKKQWFQKESCVYTLSMFLNLLSALFSYLPSQARTPGPLVLFLALQPLGAVSARVLDKFGPLSVKINLIYLLSISSCLYWLSQLYPGWYRTGDWKFYNYLFFAAVVWVFLGGVGRISGKGVPAQPAGNMTETAPGKKVLSYVLAFFLIAFSINTLFNYDPFHYSFYLGPVTDLAGGKSLLVNINSQYGILVIYFLRMFFLFLPLGFTAFSFVMAVITGIQYMLFFFVVRKLFRSEILALFSLVVLLIINHLIQLNAGILYPSVGALRFGFIYVFMALIVLRNQFPEKKRLFYWGETIVAGIAFFWSFEVCVYAVVPYLGLLVYESVDFKSPVKFRFRLFLERMMMLTGCLLVIAGLLYGDVFRRTHEWPHWSYYFDFLMTYGNGLGMLEVPPVDYWWLVAGILYFSFFALLGILFGSKNNIPPNFNLIVILVFCGILEFTYYLRRADNMNLEHTSMPAILLAIYWLYFVKRYNPPALPFMVKKTGYLVAVLLAALFLQKSTGLALQKLRMQPKSPWVMINRVLSLPAHFRDVDAGFVQIENTMEKYSGGSKSLVYFLGEGGLGFSMYSGKTNLYPYNDIIQPTVSPKAMERILAFEPPLKPGDCIYSGTIPADGFEKKLLDKLEMKFTMELLEQSNGISVYKIVGSKTPS